MDKLTEIKERALDLLKQATTEKSHYYVAKVLKELLSEVERLDIDNCGHSYALNVLRSNCGLGAGESYQEVDAYILKLQKENKKMQKVVDAAQKYCDTFACKLTLVSSMTVPTRGIDGRLNGEVKREKLSETHFDGLGELHQALQDIKDPQVEIE